MNGVENATALLVALAVVKLAELAIRKVAAIKNGDGKDFDRLVALLKTSIESEGNSTDALKQIVDLTGRELETMKGIEKELSSIRSDLRMLSHEQSHLQRSVDKLHDRFDKMTDLRGYTPPPKEPTP